MAAQPAATALTERFGPGVMQLGPLATTAAASHVAAEASGAPSASWSTGGLFVKGSRSEQPSAGCKPAWEFGWSADEDLPYFEQSARGKQLVARMTRSGGRTEACFSPAGQLDALIARCKGEANFNKAVYAVLDRLARNDGGLQLDWFQLGVDQYGSLGVICFTCDDDHKAKVLTGHTGSVDGSPFSHFIRHCETATKHAKARDKLRSDIDAIHSELENRGEENITRCAGHLALHALPPRPY